jgi:transposase InsO family protein
VKTKKINDLYTYLKYAQSNKSKNKKKYLFSLVDKFSKYKTITYLCNTLDVSRNGYYLWKERDNDKKIKEEKKLIEKIKKIQKKYDYTLGYRRMHLELSKKYEDFNLSESTVYRRMKKYGLLSRALYTKKNVILNRALLKYKNQLEGNFDAFFPNMKWCIDMTKICTDEGDLYMAAIIDLHDRYLVNYKILNAQRTQLVTSTINQALEKEGISGDTPLLLHSDQGTQFTTTTYNKFTRMNNIVPSMSDKGKPSDNAVIESFFATLKNECVSRYNFKTKKEAKEVIGEFIYKYNNLRRQLKSKKTPVEIRTSAA